MTSQTDFGVALGAVLSGEAQIPPLGLRVDIGLLGTVDSPALQGTIEGVDYLRMEGDGTGRIHAHSVITTNDGARISAFAEGIAVTMPGTPISKLTEMETLQTESPEYAWVNNKRFFAVGQANVQTGEIVLECYAEAEEMEAT